MPLKAPTIVIFDMDGTTVRHLNPRLLHILEKLDDTGYACSRFFRWLFRKNHPSPIIKSDDPFINRKKPRLLVHRAIHKFRRKDVDQIVEPCPGIYETLDLLKQHNIPTALVSNGLGKGYGHDILKTFDLEKYFEATIFREDITRSKPDPEPLLTALSRMGIETAEKDVIWYIGDRRKDILAALNFDHHVKAKVTPIAYALNAIAAVIEKGLGPEHIMVSYVDMTEELKDLLGADQEDTPGKKPEPVTSSPAS